MHCFLIAKSTDKTSSKLWAVVVAFIALTCTTDDNLSAQFGPPGGGNGGSSGNEGSGGSGALFNHIVEIAGSGSSLTVTWEFDQDYPDQNQEFEPYLLVYRGGAEVLRKKLDVQLCTQGEHSLSLNLGTQGYFSNGQYGFVIIYFDGWQPDVFGFGKGFIADSETGDFQLVETGIHNLVINETGWAPTQHIGCTSCEESLTPQQGWIGPGREDFTERIVLYNPVSRGGCASCGGSPIQFGSGEFELQLKSLWDLASLPSLAGMGFYLDVIDSSGRIFLTNNQKLAIRMHNMPGICDVITMDQMPDADTGQLTDPIGFTKSCRVLDGSSPTNKIELADSIEVSYFNGSKLIYECVLTPDGSPDLEKDLRLVQIVDRCGRVLAIDYSHSSERRIDTVTDSRGNVYRFAFGEDIAGRPTISNITFPNGTDCAFEYADNFLTKISTPDWEWTATVSNEPSTQTVCYATSHPTDGRKRFKLTQDFILLDDQILNQPASVCRSIETDYGRNVISMFQNPNNSNEFRVLRGDDQLSLVTLGQSEQFAKEFSVGNIEDGYDAFTDIQFESFFAHRIYDEQATQADRLLGVSSSNVDIHGYSFAAEFDSDNFVTKRTYSDGTFEEINRNTFKQVTRFRDRIGRVTKYLYDSRGNTLERHEGILEIDGTDVNQPEYAIYKWDYYPPNHSNACMLKTEFSPRNNGESDLFRVDYVYDANNRLVKRIDSADIAGGERPEWTSTYYQNGLLETSTDPMGRTATYLYDSSARVVQVTYNDGSTEQTYYDPLYGKPKFRKNRNGVVSRNRYLSDGKLWDVIANFGQDDNILDGDIANVESDINQQAISIHAYSTANGLSTYSLIDGNRTEYTHDHRRRLSQSKSSVAKNVFQISRSVYDDRNRPFYTEDNWGRRTYSGYRISDGSLVRTIQGMHDDVSFDNNLAVLNATRSYGLNESLVISDAIKNLAGEVREEFDPFGIRTVVEFDSRGRETKKTEAVGTDVERKTETDYDLANNLTEIRHPRYFDPEDENGHNVCKTNRSYNGRNLLSSETEATGSEFARTVAYKYHLDGKQAIKTDPKGNEWRTDFHDCCGRFLGSRNPLGHGTFSNTDFMGKVTHTAIVENYDEHFADSHNLINDKTFEEKTIRFDDLGRRVADTVWLHPQDSVDPNAPPIAGINGSASSDGYTTQTIYDNNLTDGQGFDSEQGIVVEKLGGGSFNVSLTHCLNKLKEPFSSGGASIEFEEGFASGSAIVTINAAHNIEVTISDGLGQPVMQATIESFAGENPNHLVTWACKRLNYREVQEPNFGNVVESVHIDAEGNTRRIRTTANNSSVSILDPESNLSVYKYDATGRLKETRDPNGVGLDLSYDELGRITSRQDTFGDVVSFKYDAADNLIEELDAKLKTTFFEYDVQNQKAKTIDRVSAETVYTFDLNGNVESITDAANQTTLVEYDSANQKIKTVFPDHADGAQPGNSEYGTIAYDYDPAGRIRLKTDQLGDSCETLYNLAGFVVARNYRLAAESPNGEIAESDSFVLDAAGRIVSATSSRYQNTVTRDHDPSGRIVRESLEIGPSGNKQTYDVSRKIDFRGQTESISYPNGKRVDREYTKQGWISNVFYDNKVVNSRSYDDSGRLKSVTAGNGVVTTYQYRGEGQLKDDFVKQIEIEKNDVSVEKLIYTYAPNKNVASETRLGDMSRFSWNTEDNGQSGFDDENRLTHWALNDNSLTQHWSLSPVGTWDSLTSNDSTLSFQHDDTHEIESIGETSIQHDQKGNVSANLNGHLYSWDFNNQLMGVDTDGDGGAEVSFAYDAFGRRVRKTSSAGDVVFVHAGQQVVSEYGYGDSPTTPKANVIYATYLDEPILRDEPQASGSGNRLYFHCDRRFNVIALSDENGVCQERYAYSPFGQLSICDAEGTTISESAVKNTITHTGRAYDPETELYFFRARYFDPYTGSFISRDPMGYVDGMSLYSGYFAPSFLDPMGTRRVMGQTPGGATVYWSNVLNSCVIDIPGPSGTLSQKPVQCPYRGGWKSYGVCKRSATVTHKGKIRGGGFRNLDWKGDLTYTCTAGGKAEIGNFKNFWASINKGSYLFNFPDSIAVGAGATWGPVGLGVTRSWRGTLEYERTRGEDVSCGDYMVQGSRIMFSANLRIYYDIAIGIKGSTFASDIPNVEGSVGSSGSFLEYHYKEEMEFLAYCCKCSPRVCGVKPEHEKVWFDRTHSDTWQIHVIEDQRRKIVVKQPSGGSGSRSMPETRW